ncbi:hypothetical protein DSM26151_23730 [Agromyces marinus]|nr:hypothetical protein DSM26151_23730 [Agromyces marinus]
MQPADPVPGIGPDGRPDPGHAAALGLVPASAGRRSAAFSIDAAVWAVVATPAVIGLAGLVGALAGAQPGAIPDATALTGPLILVAAGQVLLTVLGIVQLALHGRKGVTIGKASLGLRSVNVATFERPGFWRVVLRALVLWLSNVVLALVGPALCFASGLWDPEARGRSWLDRIGRCYVVDTRRGLDPFDAKALRHARRALDATPRAARETLPSLASDRGIDDRTFIPAARSSSGVVASPATGAEQAAGGWTPPPLPAQPAQGSQAPGVPALPAIPPAPAAAAPAASPAAAAPAASPAAAAPEATLVFTNGLRVPASGTTLLGRSPAPADADPLAVALVPLDDASMGLSKTHAAVEVDGRGIRVTDRWSSNGTVLVAADGSEHVLEPGVASDVPPGAAVRLGGLEFRIEGVRP